MATHTIPFSRFHTDLSRSLSKKGRALLKNDRLPEEMAKMEPLEAYYLVKEIGLEDAVPLVLASTHEQWQTYVDFDCWKDGLPDATELATWLAPFAATGPDELTKAFLQLDEELQCLFLASCLRIEERQPEDEGFRHVGEQGKSSEFTDSGDRQNDDDYEEFEYMTPDGFYQIMIRQPVEWDLNIRMLLEVMYRLHLEDTYKLLTAVRWESMSMLEEQALTFRAGRLQDLGFPDPVVAKNIFSKPTKNPADLFPRKPYQQETHLPAFYVEAFKDESFFTEVLLHLNDRTVLGRIEEELVFLINTAVVAYWGRPNDLQHVRQMIAHVRDTLSLGLDHLIDMETRPSSSRALSQNLDRVGHAKAILEKLPIQEVFKFGYHCAYALRLEVQSFLEHQVFKTWFEKTYEEGDAHYSDWIFIKGFLDKIIFHQGFDAVSPQKKKAFSSLDELKLAGRRLARLANDLSQ